MRKCRYCGTDLPENSRFCGNCGSVQGNLAADAQATRINTPQPPPRTAAGGTIPASWPPYNNYHPQGSAPAWSPNAQAPATPPPPPIAANQNERRDGILPWPPLYDAMGGNVLMGSGQIAPSGSPFVQGAPQINGFPSVSGTPTPYPNAPSSYPMQGAGNAAPVSHPVQAPGSSPVSHPVQGPGATPISHPTQGPVNRPVSHPIHSPQPTPHPPEPPHHHPHGPHRHHDHPAQHEPGRGHTHSIQHEPHRVARVTKVAGGSSIKIIILVVTIVAVGAATIGVLALGAFNHPQKPILSSGPGANLTQVPTPTTTLIPTNPAAVFSSGTWQGQGIYNDGQPPFDMTLMITVNGNAFSGTLTENVYSTTVNVRGTIRSDVISFTDTSYVSGDQIALDTTYTGIVSNGSIRGTWVYANPQDGNGTFTLNLKS